VLAAILLPCVQRARALSHSTKCLSNLRAIHTATVLYAEDNGDRLPPKFEIKKQTLTSQDIKDGRKLNTLSQGIQTALEPYAPAEVFRCPSDRGCFGNFTPLWQLLGASYEVKGVMGKDRGTTKEDLWSQMALHYILASDPWPPWEFNVPAKVVEKMNKGERGPLGWHPNWYNIILANGRAISISTPEEQAAAQGK